MAMSLTTPDNIRTLQRKLYLKAKAEPNYRFYLLYDKVHRADILRHAYDLVRANKGAPGVDGVSFAAIEAAGLESWLVGIETELRTKTYQPQPVRRVMIPKPGGGERPLGIPDDPGPRGADRRETGAGADLRGGPRTHCLWLPTGPQRHRCGQGGAPTAVPGVTPMWWTPTCRSISIRFRTTNFCVRSRARIVDRHVLRLIKTVAQDTGRGNGPGWDGGA